MSRARARRPTGSTLVAVLVALAVGGCGTGAGSPDASPCDSVHQAAATSAEGTSQPTPGCGEAAVIARIQLPTGAGQTPATQQVAVTDDAIWIAGEGRYTHLVRVDVAGNRVTSDVVIDPALLATGDGQLWMLSPWGVVPDTASLNVSRVDLVTGVPEPITSVTSACGLAVGLGGTWVVDGVLFLVDPASGRIVRALSARATSVDVACRELWTWEPAVEQRAMGWLLRRIDARTAITLERIALPEAVETDLTEIDGMCWTVGGGELFGIAPGRGLVTHTQTAEAGTEGAGVAAGAAQIAGASVWSTTPSGLVQRIDPLTGAAVGEMWRLPEADLHVDPKGNADWRLLSAGGNLWLLGGDQLVRYDIPT
jgi:hypothetical protein